MGVLSIQVPQPKGRKTAGCAPSSLI